MLGDVPASFEPGKSLLWKKGDRTRDLKLSGKRHHSGRLLLTFEGIAGVEAARALSGGALCLPAERLPAAPADFYWSHEVAGWRCESRAGEALGSVRLLEDTPAGPLLTMETPRGKEILVPFVHSIVVRIDREAKKIVLDPPEGLLDL